MSTEQAELMADRDLREVERDCKPESQVDENVMCVKQILYEHGGSRIYIENEKTHRGLLVDTYHTKEFAVAIKEFTENWLIDKKHGERNRRGKG